MDQNNKIVDKTLSICEYLLASLIILDCNSVYANLVNSPYNLQKLSLILSAILIFIICWKYKIKRKHFLRLTFFPALPVLIWAMLLLLFIKVEGGYMGSYIKYFVLYLPISIILFKIYKEINKHYQLFFRISDVMLVLSIASLALWFAIGILKVAEPSGTIAMNWGGLLDIETYKGIYFQRTVQMENISFLGISIFRNIGLYPESPMFDIVLVISLYTELFLKNKTNGLRSGTYIITICSTFGTLGIMLAVLGLFLKFCIRIQINKRSIHIMAGLVILFCVIISILLWNKRLNGFGSYSTHLDDFVACIKAWITSPIFGTGFENYREIQINMADFRKENGGITTSAGAVLAQGGIGLFLLYFIPFVMYFRQYFIAQYRNVALWGIGALGLFVTSIFQYRFLMLLILAFGYSWIDINSIHIREKKRDGGVLE